MTKLLIKGMVLRAVTKLLRLTGVFAGSSVCV
jgi:hypothetical protein